MYLLLLCLLCSRLRRLDLGLRLRDGDLHLRGGALRRRASLRIRRSRRDNGLRLLHHLRLLDIMMLPVLRRLDLVRERARRSRWMACDCQRTRPIRLHAGL